MEHVEIDDHKMKPHRLYKDLVCGGSGYGARRWTVTLERMCERLSLSSISAFPTTDYGGGTFIIYVKSNILYRFVFVIKKKEEKSTLISNNDNDKC